ncbi:MULTISPECIES: methyl-accepting chemotaxis protein [Rhizobium]|uniref:Cache 3/Cache 2 fusion domain-containing protein n=1 Tax=Rhizobium indicum TaxID=2583231 RepID=A0ABX6PEN5_9HYPH|nr:MULTISPECIES: methyl-accepting chemotaxis protein [Rhizobium]MBB4505825.1 methyl-accepting chemotaxis protein [Rhizobium leguminosarum]MBY5776015.1 HAMP domain-containing protein [Rhizobium leguminosarum]MBY5784253.1 HAMP domain-containing protein [Rhizobium leguminosarum]QKK16592.1 Cache 3/Cache 2 fusion domain-containing protein [Rhizobium indicum]TBZ19745.1 methyl-accepting chemotaxis protein [Rhizobium leguminosarum bv. viciae]
MLRLFSTSIVRQIVAITLFLLAISTAAIVGVTYYNLSHHVMDGAVSDARDATRAMAVLYGAADQAAKIELKDNQLSTVTEDAIPALADHSLVDRTAQSIAGVATIFQKQGSDYVRISTNVKKENGDRAVGTKLVAEHPAQPVLARGEAYYGPAELFGRKFMTGYFPIKNASNANVGILFIGIPMELYYQRMYELQMLVLGVGAIVMLIVGVLAFYAIRLSVKPLQALTTSVHSISAGDLEGAIPCVEKRNEFGDIGRALALFRDSARARRDLETQAAEQRELSDAERARNDADKRSLDGQIDFAVNQLAAGLGRLSQGDVSQTIGTPFVGRLEQLRVDFNASLLRLQDTLSGIRDSAATIQRNSGAVSASAGELSKRTEAQAANLEETAAAVEEITVTVRSSAERAREANNVVAATKKTADNSGAVVGDAVAAMDRIEQASQRIEQIIEVIDDIAFQTNLLALNAGIEAARAGEAGKGFAVVAQEVRELAQRSADAAREIKSLIETSSREVTAGSELVQKTGSVLASISQEIIAISGHVETIATASRDQSAALQEVNGSVNAMDQMTQKNAAMVAETTQASRLLAGEADTLMALIERFRIVAESAPAHLGTRRVA